jgi:hypothetical protein
MSRAQQLNKPDWAEQRQVKIKGQGKNEKEK